MEVMCIQITMEFDCLQPPLEWSPPDTHTHTLLLLSTHTVESLLPHGQSGGKTLPSPCRHMHFHFHTEESWPQTKLQGQTVWLWYYTSLYSRKMVVFCFYQCWWVYFNQYVANNYEEFVIKINVSGHVKNVTWSGKIQHSVYSIKIEISLYLATIMSE